MPGTKEPISIQVHNVCWKGSGVCKNSIPTNKVRRAETPTEPTPFRATSFFGSFPADTINATELSSGSSGISPIRSSTVFPHYTPPPLHPQPLILLALSMSSDLNRRWICKTRPSPTATSAAATLRINIKIICPSGCPQ